jgi:hypothetical protein
MNAQNAAIHCDVRPGVRDQVLVTHDLASMLDEGHEDIESSTAKPYWRVTASELSLAERKIEWPE